MFKFTNVVCGTLNDSWIIFSECRLYAINRNKTTLTIVANAHYAVNQVLIDAQLFKKASGYKPWVYKGKFDGCQFQKKQSIPIVKFIFNMLKNNTNMVHTCPYIVSITKRKSLCIYFRFLYIENRVKYTLGICIYKCTIGRIRFQRVNIWSNVCGFSIISTQQP